MQRLVSSLPKGRHFWDLLRGDLLHLEDDFYLCHFVDDATHLSVGGVMKGKSPEDVIEVLMDTVLTRPSAPRRILFDNGGEFINEKVQEVLEGYGVEICSTPSYAPWTHGGVESHHVPIIAMARAYKIDLPKQGWNVKGQDHIPDYTRHVIILVAKLHSRDSRSRNPTKAVPQRKT